MAAMSQTVDTKLLGKPPYFSGEEHDWKEWSFQFKVVLKRVSLDAYMLVGEG